jgi:hypothetical protein
MKKPVKKGAPKSAKPVKKPVKKGAPQSAKKFSGKMIRSSAQESAREAIDESMAVALQATGLGQLQPIEPIRRKAVRAKDEPTPR